jgi:hypothetical protein
MLLKIMAKSHCMHGFRIIATYSRLKNIKTSFYIFYYKFLHHCKVKHLFHPTKAHEYFGQNNFKWVDVVNKYMIPRVH